MVAVAPAAKVPSEQGKADTQSPALDTKVRPVGVVSVTTTEVASEAPLLVIVIVYVRLVPGFTPPGANFTIERSALLVTGDDDVEVLLPGVGSVVVVDTVAVLSTGLGVVYDDGAAKVLVMVRVAPAGTMPSEHGNALTQAPVFDTNVRPVGDGSATLTAAASDTPLLVTTMVKTALVPGVTEAGPVLTTCTSALGLTGVDDVEVLLPGVGSVVVVDTVAVLSTGFGVVYEAGTE